MKTYKAAPCVCGGGFVLYKWIVSYVNYIARTQSHRPIVYIHVCIYAQIVCIYPPVCLRTYSRKILAAWELGMWMHVCMYIFTKYIYQIRPENDDYNANALLRLSKKLGIFAQPSNVSRWTNLQDGKTIFISIHRLYKYIHRFFIYIYMCVSIYIYIYIIHTYT